MGEPAKTININGAPVFLGYNIEHNAGFAGVWPDATIRRPEWGNWGAGVNYLSLFPATDHLTSDHSITTMGVRGPHDSHPEFHILGAHAKYFLNPWGKDFELSFKAGAGIALPYYRTYGEKVLKNPDEKQGTVPSFFAGASLIYWMIQTDDLKLNLLSGIGASVLTVGTEVCPSLSWEIFDLRF